MRENNWFYQSLLKLVVRDERLERFSVQKTERTSCSNLAHSLNADVISGINQNSYLPKKLIVAITNWTFLGLDLI
jgi:hypothetical protein